MGIYNPSKVMNSSLSGQGVLANGHRTEGFVHE